MSNHFDGGLSHKRIEFLQLSGSVDTCSVKDCPRRDSISQTNLDKMSVDYSRENSQKLRSISLDSPDFPKTNLQPGNGKGQKIVFVACGSYSPITYMHLRMFEQARDYCCLKGMNVIGGYFSPVTDAYGKKGLVEAQHRVKMCQLAVESSDWIMVDPWESRQQEYRTTIVVLDHFNYCLNKDLPDNEKIQVKLLCGSDLLESFSKPGVWATEDIEEILSRYGVVVLERVGSDCRTIITDNDTLWKHQDSIVIVPQWISNDISSTKIRQNIARGLSIKYLTADSVVQYIHDHKLYRA